MLRENINVHGTFNTKTINILMKNIKDIILLQKSRTEINIIKQTRHENPTFAYSGAPSLTHILYHIDPVLRFASYASNQIQHAV